jgi:hypothetical protein
MLNLFATVSTGTAVTIPTDATLLWVNISDSWYSDNQGSVQMTVVVPTFTVSPTTLNLSTGDSNRFVTTTATPQVTFTPTFTVGSQTNSNSSCDANPNFSQSSGTGSVNTTVTASPAGCSRIFSDVRALVGSATSTNGVTITVPPQIMIKVIIGEAQAQPGDTDQHVILSTARNRFGDSDFPGGTAGTWQAVIIPSEFYGASNGTTNGPDRELRNAAQVFTGAIGDIVGGSKCLWSPTNSQYSRIQTALSSGTTTFPSNTGAPACWGNLARQIVVKQSVGLNVSNGNQYRNALAFVFMRRRAATDPAVVQIP